MARSSTSPGTRRRSALDRLSGALAEIAPVALRYGATDYRVYRSLDDRYKFLQVAGFEDKLAFARYWDGPEFIRWRAIHSSWFQVPVLYAWQDVVAEGALEYDQATVAEGAAEPTPEPPAAA